MLHTSGKQDGKTPLTTNNINTSRFYIYLRTFSRLLVPRLACFTAFVVWRKNDENNLRGTGRGLHAGFAR